MAKINIELVKKLKEEIKVLKRENKQILKEREIRLNSLTKALSTSTKLLEKYEDALKKFNDWKIKPQYEIVTGEFNSKGRYVKFTPKQTINTNYWLLDYNHDFNIM